MCKVGQRGKAMTESAAALYLSYEYVRRSPARRRQRHWCVYPRLKVYEALTFRPTISLSMSASRAPTSQSMVCGRCAAQRQQWRYLETVVFPSLAGRPILRAEEPLSRASAGIKVRMLGDEAAKFRNCLQISHPMEHGMFKNWEEDMKHVGDCTFNN